MNRKPYEWKLRTRSLQLGDRTLIMGVLNVSPDSFSDGGKYSDPDRAFARAVELEEQGADLIDVGAESTRPGSERISEAEELRRLIPVLKRLQGRLNVPVSVDTYKSGVAEKALELGVEIINDPSGLTFDLQLGRVVSNADAGLVLNHMRGTPENWAKLPPMKNVAGTVAAELDAAIHRTRRFNVEPKKIVVDPGIGFGKRREQNSELIARLKELTILDRPILVGPSRKQFLMQTEESGREFATAAAVAACILNGAHIVRVHDVKAMLAAVQVADAIVSARPEPREEAEQPKEQRQRRGPRQPEEDRPLPARPPLKRTAENTRENVRPPRPGFRPADDRPREGKRPFRPAPRDGEGRPSRPPRRPGSGPRDRS